MKIISGIKLGKLKNPEKKKQKKTRHFHPQLAIPRLELETPVGTEERSNCSYAETANYIFALFFRVFSILLPHNIKELQTAATFLHVY